MLYNSKILCLVAHKNKLIRYQMPNFRKTYRTDLVYQCKIHWKHGYVPSSSTRRSSTVLTKCACSINSHITVCKTSPHILRTASPLTHSSEPHIPTTTKPVLLASLATGTLGVLSGMGCPHLPQGLRQKRELWFIAPSPPDQHAGFPSMPGARLTARWKVW